MTAFLFTPRLAPGRYSKLRHRIAQMTPETERYQSDGLKLFLCHSSGDKQVIKNLRDRLLADGFWPWLDVESLRPGLPWQAGIREAIEDADAVLICLSPGVNSKAGYVNKEIKLALAEAEKKPKDSISIVPVRLEECEIPKRLASRQWVDLFEPGGYERLASTIREGAIDTRPSAAIAAYDRVLQNKPGNVNALVKRGIAFGNVGNLEMAIQNFDSAIKMDRNCFLAWLERGKAYGAWASQARNPIRWSRIQVALNSLNRAIELQAADAYAYYVRGECYATLCNNDRRALEDYNHALGIEERLVEAYVGRGFCLSRLGQQRYAIQDFEEALRLQAGNPEAYFGRGRAYHDLKIYDQASADFDEAIRIEPNHSWAYQFRGWAKQKLGDREGARADFTRAKELGYDG